MKKTKTPHIEPQESHKELIKAESKLAGCSRTEDKLSIALDYAEEFINNINSQSLKNFWALKKIILELFKEKIDPITKNTLWSKYSAINNDATKLKELKDQQSEFLVEQIKIAITDLEETLKKNDALLKSIPKIIIAKWIPNKDFFILNQQQLELLKSFTQRLDNMRSEILQIDLRVSLKNQLLKKLAKIGDQIFPQRRQIVADLSSTFIIIVEKFSIDPFFAHKDESKIIPPRMLSRIKDLQNLAKHLGLNSACYVKTKEFLNKCWKIAAEKNNEYQKTQRSMQGKFEETYNALLPVVEDFELKCTSSSSDNKVWYIAKSEELLKTLTQKPISNAYLKELRTRVNNALNCATKAIESRNFDKIESRKAAVKKIKEELDSFIKNEQEESYEEFLSRYNTLKERYSKLQLSRLQKHMFERDFADIKSFLLEKKEHVIKKTELNDLYNDRITHYEAIKKQMEEFRKFLGGSSLDMEKAIAYRELYESAKIHLDSEYDALVELEKKIELQ